MVLRALSAVAEAAGGTRMHLRANGVSRVAELAALTWFLASGPGCSPSGRSLEPIESRRMAATSENGFSENGFSENGFSENGFSENGFSENGFSENGFSENGFSENGFVKNGIRYAGKTTRQILEESENAVSFAQYAFGCAMPPCSSPPGPGCKDFTTHLNGVINRDVEFKGKHGLAPEWGEANGKCNADCKRWV